MCKPFGIVGSAFLLLSMVTSTDACLGQGGVAWTQLNPANSPPARLSHGMAYHAASRSVVLFGGEDASGTWLNDTWEWDGNNWTDVTPAQSPPVRWDHAMAYDASRQCVVLFGGAAGTPYNPQLFFSDTWEWDGNNWTDATPTQSPPARRDHAMAYDSSRQRVVLFGGYGASGGLSDTWEWDGNNWTDVTPAQSPPARWGHPIAYDAARQRVVLFGGWVGGELNDTWEWDGVNWTQATPAQNPLARDGHAMAYDAARQRVMLFGGESWAPYLNTWEWDGSTWAPVNVFPTGLGRSDHAMAYDAARQRVVLFGGANPGGYFQDTWEYSSLSPAAFTTFGPGCAGSLGVASLAAAPFSLPWTGDTFAAELGNLPAGSFPFMAIGFTQVSTPIPQLPGCTQLSSAETAVALTLNGNTATWSQRVPVNTALVGWSLFLQGAALNAGGANPLGAALSNGGQVTIGMR